MLDLTTPVPGGDAERLALATDDLERRWAAIGTPEHRALARLVHRLERVAYRDGAGMRLGEGDPLFDAAKAALRSPRSGDAEAMRAKAEAFARKAHAGQVDKAGQPYTGHLGRVAARARAYAEARGWSPENAERCEAAGWLHDVIEHDRSAEASINRAFDPLVACVIGALTRDPDESYADYIHGIATCINPAARVVKLADLDDNLDPSRGAALSDSLRQRYERARSALRKALSLPEPRATGAEAERGGP